MKQYLNKNKMLIIIVIMTAYLFNAYAFTLFKCPPSLGFHSDNADVKYYYSTDFTFLINFT